MWDIFALKAGTLLRRVPKTKIPKPKDQAIKCSANILANFQVEFNVIFSAREYTLGRDSFGKTSMALLYEVTLGKYKYNVGHFKD